ncbi:MAG: hypothetical protein CMI30_10615 [Opitutae bacterium]|nr:hypothetical protein [Opitutae bacterium]
MPNADRRIPRDHCEQEESKENARMFFRCHLHSLYIGFFKSKIKTRIDGPKCGVGFELSHYSLIFRWPDWLRFILRIHIW